ncbi:MAG TPA: class I tRNA ligase family protein, partial [Acidobacteriaceae bacterium]|nr:class I tRNA ligase family protein [Acidobacteriaceae bacterium]
GRGFESGSSSHAVLDFDPDVQQVPGDPDPPNVDARSDLYAEGGDQHRGWFMSSLLCGIGMHNRAPFKSVATYGWTIDENGQALSKSMGSKISDEITGQLGAEIVRLWVASVDFREDVVASLPLLRRLADEIYRKLRNTFRFMLGALSETDPTTGLTHDFDPATDSVEFSAMQPIDQYILARTAELTTKIRKAYEEFEFHRVYHLLNEFCNSELSAFYLDVLKDRLYTYPIKFKPGNAEQERLYLARRSAQTAIYKITDALARLTAPILSFTADEVYQSLPHTHGSVHLTLFPTPESLAPPMSVEDSAQWDGIFAMRDRVLARLENLRTQKEIGKSLEARVEISFDDEAYKKSWEQFEPSLAELFNVSQVNLLLVPKTRTEIVPDLNVEPTSEPKCDRCWRHVPDVGQQEKYPTVCLRCAEALDAIDFPPYAATNS